MKKIFLSITLFLTLFYSNSSFTQVTDVVTGLNNPTRLALNGNDLYIAEYNGNKISKIDITAATPTATEVVAVVNGPYGLLLNGYDLYIAEFDGNKISKIDITPATPTDVVTGVNAPNGFALNGNDLYISEYSGNKISKIDITATNPTAIDVVTGLAGPGNLLLNGNDLYIAEFDGNKISKIDITATTPTVNEVVTGLNEPDELILIGNDLYIAEVGANKISKIDITAATPTLTDVVTGVNAPNGFALNGNDLYIAEFNDNKISKIDITAATPTAIDVITGLNSPTRLALNGNDLYIAEVRANKISKIDITAATPTATEVVAGVNGPFGLLLNGNDLYIAEFDGNKISKIDITPATPTDVVTGVNAPNGFALNGNDLYVSEYFGNKISKIDITATNPTAIDVVTGLAGPGNLLLNGNDLYIAEFDDYKISKIDITATNPTAIEVVTGLNEPDELILIGNDLYISEFGGNKISKIDITAATPTLTGVVTGVNGPSGFALNGNDLYISEYYGNKISKIEVATAKEFIGTTADWGTATNWTGNTLPLATDEVIIFTDRTQPVISSSTAAVANNITINASASLTVESGGALIIEGTATVNGNFIYKVNVNDDKWHLIASPVAGEQYDDTWNTTNGIATNLPKEAVANYINTTGANGDWVYFQNGGVTTTFGAGIGYSLKNASSAGGDYNFTGTFPVAPVNPAISANDIGGANENRWTLVGNPLPAYINIATFLAANATPLTDTHESVYVWNANAGVSGEYQELTTGQIHPGQAFFVNSNVASTSVTFTKAMQSHQTGVTFYRTSNPKITLSITGDSKTKSTEINYMANKTTGLDPSFDVGTFTGQASSFNLYSHLISNSEGVDFKRQALPDNNYENMVIPIGVNTAADVEITFSLNASNFASDLKIFLEDRATNTFTRLDQANSAYKITPSTTLNGIGRFYIHTSSSSLTIKDIGLENVSVFKTDASTLRIVGLQNGSKTNVTLFNLLGKQVFNTSFQSNGVKDISLPKLATGVYVVKIKADKGNLSKKIILE